MRRTHIVLWIALWAIASAWLSTTDYRSSSNDSKFYNRLVVQLVEQPVSQWVAPKWGDNYWGHSPDKYIHDHLVGNLIPGVILARLGVPAEHALNIVQMLFNIGSLFLLAAIASHFIRRRESVHLLWLLQLIPIAFTYKIRANHEQGMMFWMLFSTLGAVQYYRYGRGLLFWLIGVVGVLLVKGAPVVLMPVFAILIGIAVAPSMNLFLQKSIALVLAAVISTLAVVYAYEQLYLEATGQPFWSEYWRVQITERSYEQAVTEVPWILQKLQNFGYYLNRSIFYSAPLSLVALGILLMNLKKMRWPRLREVKNFELTERRKFYVMMLLLGLVQIAAFSTSNRLGSRYIFPVFYMFAAGFAVFMIAHAAWLKPFLKKLDEKNSAVLIAGVLWFVTFALHLGKFLVVAQ